MFVLPRNLILLVKQVQIATLILIQDAIRVLYVYITQMRISYRWLQGEKRIQKVINLLQMSLLAHFLRGTKISCLLQPIQEGGFYLPAYLYIYYLWFTHSLLRFLSFFFFFFNVFLFLIIFPHTQFVPMIFISLKNFQSWKKTFFFKFFI